MQIKQRHHWNLNTQQAKAIQLELAQQVSQHDEFGEVKLIAGTDVGFEDNFSITRAAIAVLSFPELELIEYQVAKRPTSMPYIPGYLSFRECPALLMAMEKLQHSPDLILCDVQGIAHPRRFGIASHLGVLTNMPTIGVAKSRLIGQHATVGEQKGDWQPLTDNNDTIGAAMCTRDNTLPLYISPGHKVSTATAIDFVLNSCTRYKLPETTRWADAIASNKKLYTNWLKKN